MKPVIVIAPKCNWLLHAAYLAQELLTTFSEYFKAVQLQPSEIARKFTIYINDVQVFDRTEAAGFIEIKTLKRLIRDYVNPNKPLGHSDKKM
ncbi:MAG: Rdx family protein [Flavobacterium sp.]|nr:Rdx family protein [Flavobacterium sp.]